MNPIEKIKAVPPMVWLIGGAVVVGVIMLKGGASASSGGGIVGGGGGGGGGGGEGPGTLDSLSQGFVDLVEEVRASEAADAAWKKGIEDAIAGAAPTNGNPATGTTNPKVPSKSIVTARSVWGSDVPQAIKKKYSLTSIQEVLRKSGLKTWGSGATWGVNMVDLKAALKKEHINYGSTVDAADLAKLFKKTGVQPVAPTAAKP